LVTSWAAAAFDDFATGAQVSLANRTLKNGGASFVWSNIYETVECHDSQLDAVRFSLLVYILLLGAVVLTFFSPFVLLKENSIRTPESVHLHQVHPSKAGQVLGKNLPAAITTL
jgi:hypothetical protein